MKEADIFQFTIDQHRKKVAQLKPRYTCPTIPYQDYMRFRIYKPLMEGGPFPTLLYVPGNAFVASETDYTHSICCYIAKMSRCQVVVLKHKLAPEYKTPVGLHDIYYTLRLLDSPGIAEGLNIDRNRVAIAGYSSGGNFAAHMTMRAKGMNLKIVRQILISPVTDLSRSLKGFEKYENGDKVISEQFVKWFLNLYVPNDRDKTDPTLSPHWAEKTQLMGLPPTDIIFGQFDRFRGDAQTYGKKLITQGNRTCLFMFKNENHALLWNNMRVIQAISARLAVAFRTEPLPKSMPDVDYKSLITILYLRSCQINNKEHKRCSQHRNQKK